VSALLVALLPGAFTGLANSPYPVMSFDVAVQLAELRLTLDAERLIAIRFHSASPLAFMDASNEELTRAAAREPIVLEFRTTTRRFKLQTLALDGRHEHRHMMIFMGRFVQHESHSFIDLGYLFALLDAAQAEPNVRLNIDMGTRTIPFRFERGDAATNSTATNASACLRNALRIWIPIGAVDLSQTPKRLRASVHSTMAKFELDASLGTATQLAVQTASIQNDVSSILTVARGSIEQSDAMKVVEHITKLVKAIRRSGAWLSFSHRVVPGESPNA
jgi:hypothetical protein